jgi:hypothetical protein
MQLPKFCVRFAMQAVPRAVLTALVRALQEQSASPEEEAMQQEAALLVPQLLAVLLTARPELQPLAADTNAVTDLCHQYCTQPSAPASQKASKAEPPDITATCPPAASAGGSVLLTNDNQSTGHAASEQ